MTEFDAGFAATSMDAAVQVSRDEQTFRLKFQEDDQSFHTDIAENNQTFQPCFEDDDSPALLSFGEVQQIVVPGEGFPLYEGTYHVEPSFRQQALPTKNKALTDDVTVSAIRVERVDNSHGTTVYIGTKGD